MVRGQSPAQGGARKGDGRSQGEARTRTRAPDVSSRWGGDPRPTLPYQTDASRAAGRKYLAGVHKIPGSVIRRAEQARFLHHCGNGVAFLGTGAERGRAVAAWLHPHLEGPGRAMPDTDMAVPPVLPGDPRNVVLCADGVAALRALAEAERSGEAPPTVIALYGARPENALRVLPADLQALVGQAENVRAFGAADTPALIALVQRIQAAHTSPASQPDDNDPPDGPAATHPTHRA